MSVTFRDKDSTTRLAGDLLIGGTTGDVATVQADGTVAPAAVPAPTLPHTHEAFLSPVTSVANNAQVVLSWGTSLGPDSLLNVTAPTLPTVITTGLYAFMIQYLGSNFTVGGYFAARFELDVGGTDVELDVISAPATAADSPAVVLTAAWYLTAGMSVKITVQNVDGVAARDFALSPYVQRFG